MQPEGESRSAHEDLNLFTSFDALIVFVSTVSFTALGTLLAGAYSPVCALGGGTGCALLFIHRYRRSFDWRMSAATLTSVLLLLCLALAFRLPAYRYEVGGQDQGTYWNMSRHFDRSGALPYIDKTREKIKNDPELLSIYDSNCHSSWHLADKFYFHVPGLFIDRLEQSRYTFQFYHLHPLWMSISGWIFGTENRAGSSVFFSILAIACWVLCFLELGGLPSRAVLLGACLAVHPLLSFFAKLPVSESTAGAFFAAALYYLLRFRRQAQRGVVVQGYLWI
ncbi:MAG TPA: hypothetical protein PLP17_00285, partial [Oligoflexia bacterium]|nr:hypothetical protein [Oligoflexia bacterium]